MTVNGLGSAIVVLLILYFTIRLAIKHGILDTKKEDERKDR